MIPLTDEQRNALPGLRAIFTSTQVDFGNAMPFEARARLPPTDSIPDDVTVRVETAPPLTTSVPLLDDSALKQPDHVPIFSYSLRSVTTPTTPEQTKVIFYIHGGGNLHSHPTEEMYVNLAAAMLRNVATSANPCVVTAPCYRLATVPENRFPAAIQDVLAAYDHVIGQGYKPANITIAGDSAGGNHALVLTHLVLNSGRPSPHGVVVISPASLQFYDRLSDHAKAQTETDLLSLDMYTTSSALYVRDTGFAPTDPRVSGSLIPFTKTWPKTLIFVGTGDTLIDASRVLAERLEEAGRPVEVVEYEERPHGWWLVVSVFPEEVRDAAQRVAQFVHASDEASRL